MNIAAGALQADGLAPLLLIVGALAFVALGAASAGVPAALWTGSPEISLPLIAQHATIWKLANLGFVIATVLTAAGLFVLPASVGQGGSGLAMVAAVGYAMAATGWLVTLAIRLGITPTVAKAYADTGTIDPSFASLAGLAGVLFATFILLGCGSLAVLGGALLLGGALPAWVGWGILATSLAIVAAFLSMGDTLPAFVYLPTLFLGLVLAFTP